MCYLICRTYKFERGIIMLKFQNNDTTIIATFEDFILTTYVIIDELVTVQGLAGLKKTDGVNW